MPTDISTSKIATKFVPNFAGSLIKKSDIQGGIFIVNSKFQRNNNIGRDWRSLDATSGTGCYVKDEKTLYILINNPATDVTQDSDWEADRDVIGVITPLGNWDPTTNTPTLADNTATNFENKYYVVENAGNGFDFTSASLFGGATVNLNNGDWVIGTTNGWIVQQNFSSDWNNINNIPGNVQSLADGIVIAHGHIMDDVQGLTQALSQKIATSLLLSAGDSLDLPDNRVVTLGFLKNNYFSKEETPAGTGNSTIYGEHNGEKYLISAFTVYSEHNGDLTIIE